MQLNDLLAGAGVICDRVEGNADVTECAADSRLVRPGDCFVAMPSSRTPTADFIPEAVRQGASCAIVSTEDAFEVARKLGVAAALVSDTGHRFNASIGRVCREVYGDPSSSMRVIGVTGTNGKTTTAWMVRDALNALGRNAAYLGTLGFYCGGKSRELSNTTPFPVELWQLLVEAKNAGCTDLVMEASSHALAQRRLAGVSFAAGLFTNLSQDHLDFHGSMDAYADAKKLLFTEYAMASRVGFVAAINGADSRAQQWLPDLPVAVTEYGVDDGPFSVTRIRVGLHEIELRLPGGDAICARVGGEFNVSNLTTAAAGLHALGYADSDIAHGLSQVTAVPGRFESIGSADIGVIVDYAHTPDALEKLISSARALRPHRIITVFGCGGDRDRTKRPKMAEVASRLSDVCVVTSDNPRTEDPSSIINDVVAGILEGTAAETLVDRRDAIFHAVRMAVPGDVVIIAGKGHENYQIIGHTKFPMDDRDMAREALSLR